MPRLVVAGENFMGRVAVEKHASGVPQALRMIDRDLKVFYNMKDRLYEVWGLDTRGPYMLGAWKNLNADVVTAVKKAYYVARNTGRPWKHHLQELRRRRDEEARRESKEFRELAYRMKDGFRWFGRTLYQGWRAG